MPSVNSALFRGVGSTEACHATRTEPWDVHRASDKPMLMSRTCQCQWFLAHQLHSFQVEIAQPNLSLLDRLPWLISSWVCHMELASLAFIKSPWRVRPLRSAKLFNPFWILKEQATVRVLNTATQPVHILVFHHFETEPILHFRGWCYISLSHSAHVSARGSQVNHLGPQQSDQYKRKVILILWLV